MLNIGGKFNKTVIAVVVGVIGWVTVVVESAPKDITSTEWLIGATNLAIALGVFTVANQSNASG